MFVCVYVCLSTPTLTYAMRLMYIDVFVCVALLRKRKSFSGYYLPRCSIQSETTIFCVSGFKCLVNFDLILKLYVNFEL